MGFYIWLIFQQTDEYSYPDFKKLSFNRCPTLFDIGHILRPQVKQHRHVAASTTAITYKQYEI